MHRRNGPACVPARPGTRAGALWTAVWVLWIWPGVLGAQEDPGIDTRALQEALKEAEPAFTAEDADGVRHDVRRLRCPPAAASPEYRAQALEPTQTMARRVRLIGCPALAYTVGSGGRGRANGVEKGEPSWHN